MNENLSIRQTPYQYRENTQIPAQPAPQTVTSDKVNAVGEEFISSPPTDGTQNLSPNLMNSFILLNAGSPITQVKVLRAGNDTQAGTLKPEDETFLKIKTNPAKKAKLDETNHNSDSSESEKEETPQQKLERKNTIFMTLQQIIDDAEQEDLAEEEEDIDTLKSLADLAGNRNDLTCRSKTQLKRFSLYYKHAKKKIQERRQSFEANRRCFIEINTGAELQERKKKEDAIRQRNYEQLLKECENEEMKAQSSHKKKKHPAKKAKSNSNNGSSSSNSNNETVSTTKPNPNNQTVTITAFDPIKDIPAPRFQEHVRVKRWKTTSLRVIRGFSDTLNQRVVHQYANIQDDNELMNIRAIHHLPRVELLLGAGNKDKYYTETARGYRMMAMLIRGDKEEDVDYGDVCFGVDKATKTIFHKMFTRWPGTNEDYKQMYNPPPVEELVETNDNSESSSWETVSNYAYTILQDRSIEFTFENEKHKLIVFPLT